MKIKVYTNNLKVNISDDFELAKQYFARHGVAIEWEFIPINITGYTVQDENFGSIGHRFQIEGHQSQLPLSKDYISVFCFNGNEFPLSRIPASKCETLPTGVLVTLMTYKEGDVIGETYTTLIHELMHALNRMLGIKGINIQDPMDLLFKNGQWLPYYKNDQPDALDSNFGETWKLLTPHLSKLTDVNPYQYFSAIEVARWKLKPELWVALDRMRGLASTAFVVTSGLRSPQENLNANGKPNSAHLRGLAVDLLCVDNLKRTQMIRGILSSGIPCFLEIATAHLHIDLDSSIHSLGSTIVEANKE